MKKNQYNGWIYLDKPLGITSNFALQKIKKIFKNSKAGFVGTLDPMATGFLPIALGSATKVIPYIEKANKEYLFTIRWGAQSETGDVEGKIIKKKKKYPSVDSIKMVLSNFVGSLKQSPHRYSSVKINGLRAYQLARKNIPFHTKKKDIYINDIKLLKSISKDCGCFYIKCSAGTYIRSLSESLAYSLDTLGLVTELRRIGFGDLNKKLISLDYLLSLVHSGELNRLVHPIDAVMNDVLKIQLDFNQVKRVLSGSFVQMDKQSVITNKNNVVFAKHEDNFIALGLIKDRMFHPKKLLIS